jgi:signal transduction histidine kinase
MWWNMYNMISKRADSSLASSNQIDTMVRQISSDIAQMTESQLAEVKADLAHHAREWCLRDISHDLRTPLNAIIGFTQMMESGMFGPVGNPQYLEYLRHIRESGYELLDKVEDLIDVASPAPAVRKPAAASAPRKPRRIMQKMPAFKEAMA